MQVFLIINNVGMMINACVNAKNWLNTKVYVMGDLFGMLVVLNANVINHMTLENI